MDLAVGRGTTTLVMPDQIVSDFKDAGKSGVANALHNGLNDDENQELFGSANPARIAELVLLGIGAL